mgnify:FL=1
MEYMRNALKAPQVKQYIDWLRRIEYRSATCQFSYDDLTYQKIDELYRLLDRIKPNCANGAVELWLQVDRGSIDDFGNYEEFHATGEVDTYEEFYSWWTAEFPDEVEWINFTAIEDREIGYRMIYLGQHSILEMDSRKEKSFPHDISEFSCWLVDAVSQAIHQIEAGTYNEMLERNLPPQHRTGTIRRSKLWEVWPEHKADFFEDLSQKDIDEFLSVASDFLPAGSQRPSEMTANYFFSCCALGYHANQYPGGDKLPRDQYRQHADGRDDGLLDITPDSPRAFSLWYHNREKIGGHPWEVCRGGNSTHISLYVQEDASGYSLQLAGSSWTRTIETVRFFLALYRAGCPVTIREAEMLKSRLTGSEQIGIVPKGIVPCYCHSLFEGEKVIDFMNLPSEDRDVFAAQCVWKPVKKAYLKDEVVDGLLHK